MISASVSRNTAWRSETLAIRSGPGTISDGWPPARDADRSCAKRLDARDDFTPDAAVAENGDGLAFDRGNAVAESDVPASFALRALAVGQAAQQRQQHGDSVLGDGRRPRFAGIGQDRAGGNAVPGRAVVTGRQQLDPAQRFAALAEHVGEFRRVESGIADDQRFGAIERRGNLRAVSNRPHVAVRRQRGRDGIATNTGKQCCLHATAAAAGVTTKVRWCSVMACSLSPMGISAPACRQLRAGAARSGRCDASPAARQRLDRVRADIVWLLFFAPR